MRRMIENTYDADTAHDAFASMRRMTLGVLGERART